MNEDVNGNRKLLWKEVSNAKGRKMENFGRIKEENTVWHKERMKCEGFGRSILEICII